MTLGLESQVVKLFSSLRLVLKLLMYQPMGFFTKHDDFDGHVAGARDAGFSV